MPPFNPKAMKTEIDKFNPCRDGVDFRKRFKTFEEAWNACERGDWMLWIAAKLEVDIRILTLAKGLCANTVKHLMKDKRSTAAVDAAIAFGSGEIDGNEFKTAAYASHAAACVYTTYAAYYAASAAHAATSAAASSRAAYYAAIAYAAASGNGSTSAIKRHQKQTADICREVLTNEVFRLINEP